MCSNTARERTRTERRTIEKAGKTEKMTLRQDRLVETLATAPTLQAAMLQAGYAPTSAEKSQRLARKRRKKYDELHQGKAERLIRMMEKRGKEVVEATLTQAIDKGNVKAQDIILSKLLPVKSEILLDRKHDEKILSDEERAILYEEWLRRYKVRGQVDVQG